MAAKIVILTDLHLDDTPSLTARRGDIAKVLLLRAVHHINRFIKPDITLILGDLIDRGDTPNATDLFHRLRKITDLIESPTIILPGNHDGNPDTFYTVFDRPADHLDIAGVRFIPFIDPEEPGYNARRTDRDLDRMANARQNFDGPLVALQHVPLFPPGLSDCPYNYTNANDIIAAMKHQGYPLAISGHYHNGMPPIRSDGITFLAAPALCESPFVFQELHLDDDKNINVIPHQLKLPPELRLIDRHVHTPYAYCNENMDLPKTVALASDFGLAGLVFTEHSSHLYYDRPAIYSRQHFLQNDHLTKTANYRMDDYFADLEKAGVPTASQGLELDSDYQGRPMILPEDRVCSNFLIGAVHRLQTLDEGETNAEKIADNFLAVHEKFLAGGIKVLAHPLRIFRRYKTPALSQLFVPLVDLLLKNNVAAEINFHSNDPEPDFFRLCLDAGVKISFGSDSHNLYEIGNFAPNLDFLKSIGFDGDLGDILL
jgi:putative hydrolase